MSNTAKKAMPFVSLAVFVALLMPYALLKNHFYQMERETYQMSGWPFIQLGVLFLLLGVLVALNYIVWARQLTWGYDLFALLLGVLLLAFCPFLPGVGEVYLSAGLPVYFYNEQLAIGGVLLGVEAVSLVYRRIVLPNKNG